MVYEFSIICHMIWCWDDLNKGLLEIPKAERARINHSSTCDGVTDETGVKTFSDGVVVTTELPAQEELIVIVHVISDFIWGWIAHYNRTILLAIVAKLISATISEMTVPFATKTLDDTHVSTFYFTIGCKNHMGRDRVTPSCGSLSEKMLFL